MFQSDDGGTLFVFAGFLCGNLPVAALDILAEEQSREDAWKLPGIGQCGRLREHASGIRGAVDSVETAVPATQPGIHCHWRDYGCGSRCNGTKGASIAPDYAGTALSLPLSLLDSL